MRYDWQPANAGRSIHDVFLGGTTLVLSIVAIASLKGAPFGPPGRLSEWLLPASIAGLLAVVSLGLVIRGLLRDRGPVARWRPRDLCVVVALIAGFALAGRQWGNTLLLNFGPSDFAAMMICALSIAVALAGLSRLRAVAMLAVGLLLATVGTDIDTGEARFTMGLNELADGINGTVLGLGLLVVADGLLCLAAPAVCLKTYARWVADWFDHELSTNVGIALRIAGGIAVAVAGSIAFALNNAVWDVGVLLVLGAFGVALKLLGANRLVLLMAFGYSPIIEENIRRTLVISRNDPLIFLQRPYSAGFVIVTCVILAGIGVQSMRRMAKLQQNAPSSNAQ